MSRLSLTLYLANEDDTRKLGQDLAGYLRKGDCVALRGQIGAGKSALARSIIRYFAGADTDVPSPTFTLIQTYDTDLAELWHADLYRLADASEAFELGLIDAMEEQICLLEWPEILGDLLPQSSLEVYLSPKGDGRAATIEGDQDWLKRLGGLFDGA